MATGGHFVKFTKKVARVILTMFKSTAGRLQLDINSLLVNIYIYIYIYIQTAMLGTREYTLCSPFGRMHTILVNVRNEAFY